MNTGYPVAKRNSQLGDDLALDTFIRAILELPDRPTGNAPYIGWLTEGQPKGFNRLDFVNLVRHEANKRLVWHPGSEARKYTLPFEQQGLKGRFPWCAAFAYWCLKQHGVDIPVVESKSKFTYALVEAWQIMAQKKGWYWDNDGKHYPMKGDIILFDWNQRNINEMDNDYEDHIGVYLDELNKNIFLCAEGNVHNQSGTFKRSYESVQGWISIPDGTKMID